MSWKKRPGPGKAVYARETLVWVYSRSLVWPMNPVPTTTRRRRSDFCVNPECSKFKIGDTKYREENLAFQWQLKGRVTRLIRQESCLARADSAGFG
jgi:hypothetical protein